MLQNQYENQYRNLSISELQNRMFIMEMQNSIDDWELFRAYENLLQEKNKHRFVCAWCGEEKQNNQKVIIDNEGVCKSCLEEATECKRCGLPILGGNYCDACQGDLLS